MEIYDPRYCADLGDGYMAKWADDVEARAFGLLCDVVFRRSFDAPMRDLHATQIFDWTDAHPTTTHTDIAVVVDTQDTVVAGAILLRQSMDYAGVQLKVGRPELVVCHPEYRDRGFIQHIFQLLHAKSHARGDVLQAITGIPFYYRQFGYAYAIDFDQQYVVPFAKIPKQMDGIRSISLRVAEADAYTAFVTLYDADRLSRGLLCTTPLERSYFTYLREQSQAVSAFDPFFLIDETDQYVLGYVLIYRGNYDANVCVLGAGLCKDVGWQSMLHPLLSALERHRSYIQITNPAIQTLTGVSFVLDSKHPIYTQLSFGYVYTQTPTNAWYIKVPDYQRLFEAMTPILEARVNHSSMRGYSGELIVSCYGQGYTMQWNNGRLVSTRNTRPPIMGEGANACLQNDTMLMMVFGRKSLTQIQEWHHEAWANQQAAQLLSILFPTQPSWFLWLN